MIYIIWLLCGVIGYIIGEKKNRAVLGGVLGVALGVIGVIIIAVMGPAPDPNAITTGTENK